MVQVPWPYTNAPGAEAQEGAGKLVNVYVERRGDEEAIIWRRSPGATVFVVDPTTATLAGSATFFAGSNNKQGFSVIRGSAAFTGGGKTNVARSGIGQLRGSATAPFAGDSTT